MLLSSYSYWYTNWLVAIENQMDAHNCFFVHRNSIELLIQDRRGLQLFLGMGPHRPATKVVNGRALVFENPRFFDFMDKDNKRLKLSSMATSTCGAHRLVLSGFLMNISFKIDKASS